jgi:hypothetical protein
MEKSSNKLTKEKIYRESYSGIIGVFLPDRAEMGLCGRARIPRATEQ